MLGGEVSLILFIHFTKPYKMIIAIPKAVDSNPMYSQNFSQCNRGSPCKAQKGLLRAPVP